MNIKSQNKNIKSCIKLKNATITLCLKNPNFNKIFE